LTHTTGHVYLTGRTESIDFPTTTGAYDEYYNGDDGFDAFVSVLNSDLSSLSYSTFLGGDGEDYGHAIALDGAGNVYLMGRTFGSGFPATAGAYDESHNSGYDVFVSAISLEGIASIKVNKFVTPTTNVAYHSTITYTVSLRNSGPGSDTNVLFTDTLPTEVDFASWVASPTHTSLATAPNEEITWSGTVTAGEAITWTWTVTQTGDYGETITNTADFSSTLQTGSAPATFTVGTPLLHLTKQVTPTTDVARDGVVTYTMALRNTGGADEPAAYFTDTLPTEVDFASWVVSPTGVTLVDDEIAWDGPLAVGEALTWTFCATHTGIYSETVTNTAEFSGTIQTGSATAVAAAV